MVAAPPASSVATVDVACRLCGARDERLAKVERGFRVVRCARCGLLYVNPRPSADALRRDYQDYLPEDGPGIEAWRAMMEPCEAAAAGLLAARARPGALLDVGCGYGFFVARMRARGWDARGIEPSARAAAWARGRLGLDVRAALLEDEPFPPESFDAVTAFYVIEHVSDPLDFVARCRALLRPGGILLLRYPHSGPVARLAPRADVYDAPFHLSAFAPETIARLLERAGFAAIEHAIGGATRPPRRLERTISRTAGALATALERASRGRLLLPGVSKCVIARKSPPCAPEPAPVTKLPSYIVTKLPG
jgi:SAM-dependent methyltransferase